MRKNKEYSNLLHTYCDEDHARGISGRRLLTSIALLFNGTLIYWCTKKKSETSKSSSNTETRSMYIGVLDQNWIGDFFRSIVYPIRPPSKLYYDNQGIIESVMADIITPQSRPLDVLITALHELHLRKIFDMVDTRSNMQLAELNSKPHRGKSL